MNDTKPYSGPLPEGWSGGASVTKYWNGTYTHLYHVTRPCNTCGADIGLNVSKKALEGVVKNAGLLLRNCPKCRAERKAGGPGSRGGKSRPTIEAAPVHTSAAGVNMDEIESLRIYKSTTQEELTAVYARCKDLFEEVQVLKAKLAQYELPAAFEAAKNGPHTKMPWE